MRNRRTISADALHADCLFRNLAELAETTAIGLASGEVTSMSGAMQSLERAATARILDDDRPLLFDVGATQPTLSGDMLSGELVGPVFEQAPLVLAQTDCGKARVVVPSHPVAPIITPRPGLLGRYMFRDTVTTSAASWTWDQSRADLACNLHAAIGAACLPSIVQALRAGLKRLSGFSEARVLYGQPIARLPLVITELHNADALVDQLQQSWTDARCAQSSEHGLSRKLLRDAQIPVAMAIKHMTRVLGARHYLREGTYADIDLLCLEIRSFRIRFASISTLPNTGAALGVAGPTRNYPLKGTTRHAAL
jgi:hypothetical protein